MEFRNTRLSWTPLVQNENVRVFRTNQKVDPSIEKIGSQPLSLKLHIRSSTGSLKMVTSPAEEIGGVSTFLVVDGALIWPRDRSGFGRLFLWSINKQNQNQPR